MRVSRWMCLWSRGEIDVSGRVRESLAEVMSTGVISAVACWVWLRDEPNDMDESNGRLIVVVRRLESVCDDG